MVIHFTKCDKCNAYKVMRTVTPLGRIQVPGTHRLLKGFEPMNDTFKVVTALNDAGYEFLISDMQLALTFTRIASRAVGDGDKRKRYIQNARRAYEKVLELAPRLGLTGEQQQRVNEKLDVLKLALERVGENVLSAIGPDNQ